MKLEIAEVKLPEGIFEVEVQKFEETDRKILFKVYNDWRSLCNNLIKLQARSVNLPEGLSEGSICLETGCWRFTKSIPGVNTSFDCYDPVAKKRIQVKACSVLPDLTSFGPKSVWDKIYFVDFCRECNWDGSFDIYLIDNEDIYNHKVNAKQTLRDQQIQGRRPRFSIYKEIILEKNLKPVKSANLYKKM